MIRAAGKALAAITSIAAVATGVTAVASASPPPPQPAWLKIDGIAQMGGMNFLHIVANGQRNMAGATTGDYAATVLLAGMPTGIQVVGPVTCISVHKDTASLIYPISGVRPLGDFPAGLKDAQAIQVSVRRAMPGHPAQVGLNGPMATGSFHGCEPGPTPMAFTGTIDAG
ncbi:hypothetical protein [Jongsikchunia kroppenstedtii]|uniref:hypothetical protein n=1 Tax=Jongsikchunia kroppenstedtii TaxID=1121721 RepID=UPI0005BE6F93|nr:hypothetical protein [Jongsikchunia kroppenstedtii]